MTHSLHEQHKAPHRMTAAERNAAEVQKLYGPRPLLKGEVA